MGEQVASGDRQLDSPEGGMTFAVMGAAPVQPQKPSKPFKLTANVSDSSEPAVSSETATERISSDMSGPLSGTPVGITINTHLSGFGGRVVSMLPKFAGSNPAEAIGLFRA
jgi:hypothetical protein